MKTPTNIQELVISGEGQQIEFKENFGEETLETICAFANAEGGTILVGVTDKGELIGQQVGRKSLEDWAHQINSVLDPRIKVDIRITQALLTNSKQIIEITVPESQSSAVSCRGRFFKRVGRSNQKMTGEDIAQKLMAVTKLSWDSGFEERATINDIDPEAFSRFIDLLNKNGRRPVPNDIKPEALLAKLGLSENGRLTRASILLLGANPQKFYPSAFLKIGRFRSPTQIEDDLEITGCLIQQMDKAMAWFRQRLATKFEITAHSQRTTSWEYPLEAIREALANALCHRDYRLDGHIQVRLFDTTVEFWNPGSLPSSLSVDDLLKDHESILRNKKIAEGLYNLGFIEKWGTGTLRMDELLRENGQPRPEFESNNTDRFRLRFRRSFTPEYLKNLGLNQRQIQLLNDTQLDEPITNQSYHTKFDITKRTASRELSELLAKGLLNRHGSTGKGTYYTKA